MNLRQTFYLLLPFLSLLACDAPPGYEKNPVNSGPGESTAFVVDEGQRYEKEVSALVANQCLRCHSTDQQWPDLSKSTTFNDPQSGLLVKGDAEASLLYQVVVDRRMPPDAPLNKKQVTLFAKWINQMSGAEKPTHHDHQNHPSKSQKEVEKNEVQDANANLAPAEGDEVIDATHGGHHDDHAAQEHESGPASGNPKKELIDSIADENLDKVDHQETVEENPTDPPHEHSHEDDADEDVNDETSDSNTSDVIESDDANVVMFTQLWETIFKPKCMGCHSGESPPKGIKIVDYESLVRPLPGFGRLFSSQCASKSMGWLAMTRENPGKRMPPPWGKQLTGDDIAAVKAWIDAGTPNDHLAGPRTPHVRCENQDEDDEFDDGFADDF